MSCLESFKESLASSRFFFPSCNIRCDYNIGISDKIIQECITVTAIGIYSSAP